MNIRLIQINKQTLSVLTLQAQNKPLMTRVLFALAIAVAFNFCWCSVGMCGFILSIGATPLANNSADARLPIFAKWDGIGENKMVGLNLTASIGDGQSVQGGVPAFRGTQGTRGGILLIGNTSVGPTVWQTSMVAQSNDILQFGSAPESGNSFRASNVGVTDLSGSDFHPFTSTSEVIAEFRLNTTGINDRQFQFTIGVIGGASSFMSDGTNNFALSYSGSFDVGSVSAVPEPSTMLLIGCASVGAMMFRRRRIIA